MRRKSADDRAPARTPRTLGKNLPCIRNPSAGIYLQ